MVDVAPNHMGPAPNDDFSQFVPFDNDRYYHDCSSECMWSTN